MLRILLFKFVKHIIRKYFTDGLNPIFGKDRWEGKIIAWKWLFYDEEYEKYKEGEIK